MKVLLVDTTKCNGCRCCQLACKDEHCGNDWSPYSLPQPMSGQFWCNVEEEERGRVPVVRVMARSGDDYYVDKDGKAREGIAGI